MAITTQHLRSLISNPFHKGGLSQLLQSLVNRFSPLGLLFGSLAALPGYLFLFFFPVITLVLVWNLPVLLYQAGSVMDWALIVISVSSLLLCGAISWFMVRTRFEEPSGLPLDHVMAPILFDLVGELESAYGRPVVDHIVLRSRFAIQITRTPRFGLPFLTTNTLEIGLPVLLSLPPDHVKALLARRIGQIGSRHNPVSGWLYQLRSIWQLYSDNYARQENLPGRILFAFFRFYTPFYLSASVFAAHRDELEADRYALDVINDRDVAKVMSQEIVTRDFLKSMYWPKIRQLVQRGEETRYLPYSHMSAIVQKGINREFAKLSLTRALKEKEDFSTPIPPLAKRLEYMGFRKPATPSILTESAATAYIDTETLTQLNREFDRRWLQQQQILIKRRASR